MAFLRFTKIPKHQRYEYKPRYWDPRKEELEERLRRIEEVKQGDAESVKARLAGSFRKGYQGASEGGFRQRQVRRSNLVLLGIILLLLLFSYLFISVYLPGISASLGGE